MAALADARGGAGADLGPPGSEWCLPVLVSDLAAQWAVEQDLAREGLDRDSVDAGELAARSAHLAADAAARLAAEPGIGPDGAAGQSAGGAVRLPGTDSARAARTAFVALYEAGLVDLVEAVLPRCPRCRDSLGPADLVVADAEVSSVVLRVALDDGAAVVEVATAAPELLEGVAALAVPPGHEVADRPAAGRQATVPLVGRQVPVVEDPGASAPAFVTPGHDASHWDLARRVGLPTPVAEVEGGRFAAREAAVERLAAEGRVLESRTGREAVASCAHCGTVAEARLGSHWALDGAVLDEAAAGHLGAGPAGGTAPWCLGRDLWTGVPLPVEWCAECAKATVGLAGTGSCGICFGEVRPDPTFLDPLFVAAAWAAEALRPAGGVLVGGGRPWLAGLLALALRLDPGPLTVVGAGG